MKTREGRLGLAGEGRRSVFLTVINFLRPASSPFVSSAGNLVFCSL